MEGFGLDYPEDADKFREVFFKFADDGGTVKQFFKAMINAFPDKRNSILNIPMYSEDDNGNPIRVRVAIDD